MDRIIATNSVPSSLADTAPTTGTPQFATNGNPATAQPATVLPAYMFNAIQEEIIAAIVAAGQTPDRTNNAQLLAAIRVLGGSGGQQPFSASGTFTVPTGVTAADVELWGGGGGAGANVAGTATYSFGGGGAGAGYSRKRVSGLTAGQAIPVTVGAGGTGGVSGGAAATAGGTSSFGSYVSATGGGPGGPSTGSAPSVTFGSPGNGVGGDLNVPGQSGGTGFLANNPTYAVATGGGGCFGTPTGRNSSGNLNGNPGLFPGGGGGPGVTITGSAQNGGAGAAGFVMVRW